jgi:hypothetical protein
MCTCPSRIFTDFYLIFTQGSKGSSKGSTQETMLVKKSGSSTQTADNYDTVAYNDTMSEDFSTVRMSEDGSVRGGSSRFSSMRYKNKEKERRK